MNIWENAVITTKGLSLLSKLTSGHALEITKAETGDTYVTPGLLSQLTAVVGPKQELSFRAQSYPEEGKCKLPCYLTNAGLATGYTAKQVGVYATDPDDGEILFLIVQAPSESGTVIPSEAEMPGYSAEWNLYFQYGQASGVTFTVDPTGSITRGELDVILASATVAEAKKVTNSLVLKVNGGTTEGEDQVTFDGSTKKELNIELSKGTPIVEAITEDESTYCATIKGLTGLYEGLEIIIIPNMGSESSDPYLNVNGLGEHPIMHRSFSGAGDGDSLGPCGWLRAGVATKLMYSDGSGSNDGVWLTVFSTIDEYGFSGTLPTEKGGTGRDSVTEGSILVGRDEYGMDEMTMDELAEKMSEKLSKWGPVVATSEDGKNYSAEIPGLTKYYAGLEITIIPNMTSTDTAPRLSINGNTAKRIRHPNGVTSGATVDARLDAWMSKDYPVKLIYNGECWITGYTPDKIYKYTQTDAEAGVSELPTGYLWLVYE